MASVTLKRKKKKKIEKERSSDKIHFLFVSIGAVTVSYQKFSRV